MIHDSSNDFRLTNPGDSIIHRDEMLLDALILYAKVGAYCNTKAKHGSLQCGECLVLAEIDLKRDTSNCQSQAHEMSQESESQI